MRPQVPFAWGRPTVGPKGTVRRPCPNAGTASLPEDTEHVHVGPMSDAEALDLLTSGIGADGVPEVEELGRRTGGSPYVVRMARRAVRFRRELGAGMALAAAYVDACLARGGVPALDSPVGAASLRLLEDGRPERLERYLELAVFPEGADVPLSTLSRYWGMDEPEAARLCRELAEHDLVCVHVEAPVQCGRSPFMQQRVQQPTRPMPTLHA